MAGGVPAIGLLGMPKPRTRWHRTVRAAETVFGKSLEMFGTVGPPPPPSPGAVVPPPLGNVGKRFGTGGGAALTPPSGFVAPKMFGKCQGNIRDWWGAPPQPLPGLVVPPKMFGKCWGNVRKMFGTGRGEHPHPPISGVVVSQIFRTWGGGARPSLPGILAPRSYVRKMAGKCL